MIRKIVISIGLETLIGFSTLLNSTLVKIIITVTGGWKNVWRTSYLNISWW